MSITLRGATEYGFGLASTLVDQLLIDKTPPSSWPVEFPFTLAEIKSINAISNVKIARKVLLAARTIWPDMRNEALKIEAEVSLEMVGHLVGEVRNDKDWAYRGIMLGIEKAMGSLFITEYGDEEQAVKALKKVIKPAKLKKYMSEYGDDFDAFVGEVREIIRKSLLKSAVKFELICSLHDNVMKARETTIP